MFVGCPLCCACTVPDRPSHFAFGWSVIHQKSYGRKMLPSMLKWYDLAECNPYVCMYGVVLCTEYVLYECRPSLFLFRFISMYRGESETDRCFWQVLWTLYRVVTCQIVVLKHISPYLAESLSDFPEYKLQELTCNLSRLLHKARPVSHDNHRGQNNISHLEVHRSDMAVSVASFCQKWEVWIYNGWLWLWRLVQMWSR